MLSFHQLVENSDESFLLDNEDGVLGFRDGESMRTVVVNNLEACRYCSHVLHDVACKIPWPRLYMTSVSEHSS